MIQKKITHVGKHVKVLLMYIIFGRKPICCLYTVWYFTWVNKIKVTWVTEHICTTDPKYSRGGLKGIQMWHMVHTNSVDTLLKINLPVLTWEFQNLVASSQKCIFHFHKSLEWKYNWYVLFYMICIILTKIQSVCVIVTFLEDIQGQLSYS